MLISVDSIESNNIILSNLYKQFKQLDNTVIIDMLGMVQGEKFVAGRDFKLPLNKDSLEFIYEDCLKDATLESKNLIKDIFKDLVEYAQSVRFLPFSTLKTIVDDMVEKSHIFQLLVLKNKLSKFETAGYFASTVSEAENLTKILESGFAIIDLSKLEPLFQNRFLSTIYAELEKAEKDRLLKEMMSAFDDAVNAHNLSVEACEAISEEEINVMHNSINEGKYTDVDAVVGEFKKMAYDKHAAATKKETKTLAWNSLDSNKNTPQGEEAIIAKFANAASN